MHNMSTFLDTRTQKHDNPSLLAASTRRDSRPSKLYPSTPLHTIGIRHPIHNVICIFVEMAKIEKTFSIGMRLTPTKRGDPETICAVAEQPPA